MSEVLLQVLYTNGQDLAVALGLQRCYSLLDCLSLLADVRFVPFLLGGLLMRFNVRIYSKWLQLDWFV